MFILPSIDLRHGKVVRLRKGDFADQLSYDVDPVITAQQFQQHGAKYLHIVDLDGAKEGRPAQLPLIAQIIRSTNLTVEAGGGVRDQADVAALLDAGAARVVIGTRAVQDLPWLKELIDQPRFAGKIVLALDAKDGVVATHGWMNSSGQRAIDLAMLVNDWPLEALLYTDVARDGMMEGPNVAQTRALVESTRLPVIASGGVGSIDHINQIKGSGCWGIVVGRSLYEGRIDLFQAVKASAN